MGACTSKKTEAFGAAPPPEDASSPVKAQHSEHLTGRLTFTIGKDAESVDQHDEKVVAKKQKWLAKRASELNAESISEWETIFDSMCKELNKNELSPVELNTLLRKLGTKINRPMLQLIFGLFDANDNGLVDKTEFLVAVSFLTNAEHTSDIIDLAFFIFDTNKSGHVSKEEFSTMCYALMNKVKFVLAVPVFRQAFRKHVTEEHCEENLDFLEEYEKIRKVVTPATYKQEVRRGSTFSELVPEQAGLSAQNARDLFAKYIYEGSTHQVNLSDNNRKRVEAVIKEYVSKGPTAFVPSDAFDACVNELVALMETDTMARFKDKIRNDKKWIAQEVWRAEKIKGDTMSKAQFRKWAQNNPDTFAFLQELQDALKKALYRQKIKSVLMIQRAYRARLRAKLVQVVTDAMKQHETETVTITTSTT